MVQLPLIRTINGPGIAVDTLEITGPRDIPDHHRLLIFGKLEKMRRLLTSKLEAQGRPFSEFVPGSDSVPVEKTRSYLEKMKQLRPVKRGFEQKRKETNARYPALQREVAAARATRPERDLD